MLDPDLFLHQSISIVLRRHPLPSNFGQNPSVIAGIMAYIDLRSKIVLGLVLAQKETSACVNLAIPAGDQVR